MYSRHFAYLTSTISVARAFDYVTKVLMAVCDRKAFEYLTVDDDIETMILMHLCH